MRKTLFTALLCSGLCFSLSFAAENDSAAIEIAAENLRILMVVPERAGLEALVADELSYGHSSGKLDTKESFINALSTQATDFLSIAITDQTTKRIGDTALVRHTVEADTQNKGKAPAKINLRVLQVWKMMDGQWKLIARQAIPAPL